MKHNVLLIGSGGREHAMTWRIAQSPSCGELFVAPGNAGTSSLATNVNLDISDLQAVKTFCLERAIDLVVVGPEQPLVDGIIDFIRSEEELQQIAVVGPDSTAAQLEGSKEFAKEFMSKYDIPTAAYRSFQANELEEALAYIDQIQAPYVIKADGLAAGKGVVIAEDADTAKNTLIAFLKDKQFGEASSKVVIEAFLKGIEMSCFVAVDGTENYIVLPRAKDYKRIGEGDTGLNTGGMGAISPVPFEDQALFKKIEEAVVKPTVQGILSEGYHYRGFVFIGLMIVDQNPFVIEYNVRMGDPETQVVFPRFDTDYIDFFKAIALGNLNAVEHRELQEAATTVIAVSKGYPQSYEKGKAITGLAPIDNDRIVFHAGTKTDSGQLLSNGGRVLAFTSYGSTIQNALDKSYEQLSKASFEGMTFRKDIGFDLETE